MTDDHPPAYYEGAQAFADGKKIWDCPYSPWSTLPRATHRAAWLDGFKAARRNARQPE